MGITKTDYTRGMQCPKMLWLDKHKPEKRIISQEMQAILDGGNEFGDMVVTELKEKYPHIQRIAYFCKHESGSYTGEGARLKQQIKQMAGREVYVAEYEDIKKSDRVNSAGRASYVERNYWMIDDSDYTIFLLQKGACCKYISGTEIAYNYGKKKQEMQNGLVIIILDSH